MGHRRVSRMPLDGLPNNHAFGRRFKPASIKCLRATDRLTFALTDQASTASDNGVGNRTAVNTDPPAMPGRPTFLL
jgi:hypothetical protein